MDSPQQEGAGICRGTRLATERPALLAAGRTVDDADTPAFEQTVSLTRLAGGPYDAMTSPRQWLRARDGSWHRLYEIALLRRVAHAVGPLSQVLSSYRTNSGACR